MSCSATQAMTKSVTADRPVILHTRIVSGAGGGPEKTILNSPRFLRKSGYECACLYLHPPGDLGIEMLKQKAIEADAEMIAWEDGAPIDLALVKRLQQFCRERNVAIWHAHDYKTNVLGLLVRRRWPMKLVTTTHGWVSYGLKTQLYHTAGKMCLPFHDAVIAVSEDLFLSSRRWLVSAERSFLVENAIDTDAYRRTLRCVEARRLLGAEKTDGFCIAALGRLEKEKGFDLLIDSVAEMRQRGHDITLWIGGEGTCRATLQEQIVRLGLRQHVQLLGQLDDPRILLQAADLFVLSSRREGLPNVVLEAMALECPVVSTRVAGVPRLIQDGVHGLLVDIGNVSQLIAATEKMIENPALRVELARGARDNVVESFAFDKRMKKVAAVYDQLLK